MSAAATSVAIENEHLRIELDPETGAVLQVANRGCDLRLLTGPPGPPWRILLLDGTVLEQPTDFHLERRRDGVELRWSTARGDLVRATVTLPAGDPNARFNVEVDPAAGFPVEAIEYPVLGGIGPLAGDGADDRLLHSYATGFLFENPVALFGADGDGPERGLLHSPYPEGFSGSTLQLLAYYSVAVGGFYFATEDATGAQKWLNFFGEGGGHCRAAFAHGSPDLSGPLAPPYPVTVGALIEGTWTEAADRYKAWAVDQPWCGRPLASRPEQERWLHEQIGIVTFGINASHDRAHWLRTISEIAGAPVLHILGPNWAKEPQNYENHLPGGLADWFPAQFHPANLAAIHDQGDRWAPFLFDLLFGASGSDSVAGDAALQSIPEPALSFDKYEFPFLCPTTPFLQELHRERAARIAGEYDADAIYYDISANNVIKRCYGDGHGHPRGGGAFLVDAFRELYSTPSAPRGTELVNEVFADRLDFYQARAEASPVSSFEADRFREWIKDGRVEKVPLFAYVYHEYGPVRMDGWAKLSGEQGDLFYWIGARVLAWGGLFELNYEFSPLETIDGRAEPLDEHYFPLPDRRYEIDPEKAAFVRELATARIGAANPYLAYGSMLPPLTFESPTIELSWLHYNCPTSWPAYGDSGTHRVPAVVHCGWRHERDAAVVLVNVDRVAHEVRVPANTRTLRLEDDGVYELTRIEGVERATLGRLGADGSVAVSLPPRTVVVLEATRRLDEGQRV
ncbi:MAG TPA: DUF6259 domain-containing protein [Gaiellaceae bacterium]|nr:DUF6259 domain-containing protein [Gaiellaceae bacterium]